MPDLEELKYMNFEEIERSIVSGDLTVNDIADAIVNRTAKRRNYTKVIRKDRRNWEAEVQLPY